MSSRQIGKDSVGVGPIYGTVCVVRFQVEVWILRHLAQASRRTTSDLPPHPLSLTVSSSLRCWLSTARGLENEKPRGSRYG